MCLLGCLTGGSARGQEPGAIQAKPEGILALPWVPPAYSTAPEPPSAPDVDEHFDAFQRDFVAEFGGEIGGEKPDPRAPDAATRIGERLMERFEGSRIFGWYQGAMGLYERFERLHHRVQASTRWNRNGFAIDTDVESVVDGSVKLHVERRVRGFKVGFDLHDATEGRVGLRVGGVMRGYQINVDLGDLGTGQLRFGVKKRME